MKHQYLRPVLRTKHFGYGYDLVSTNQFKCACGKQHKYNSVIGRSIYEEWLKDSGME